MFVLTKMNERGRAGRIVHLAVVLAMVGLLLAGTAGPALAAQGGGGGIGGALDSVVTAITDIIQTVCIGLGILGLSIWGIGKIARPIFPQIGQFTQNYMSDLIIGLAVVFIASQVVEGLASALGTT